MRPFGLRRFNLDYAFYLVKLLITGICGFVGSTIATAIKASGLSWELIGLDNLSRRGSEQNLALLKTLGVRFFHADLRSESDLQSIPAVDWILDAAANPSVLAGADGKSSTRQLMEHNLIGTINLLEKCQRERAGFILLSTSRVYSIPPLSSLPVVVSDDAYQIDCLQPLPVGVAATGISEAFSTATPVSLYGASKLASEIVALEYGHLGNFPVWINRCGVLAGAGQFGRADQGIFAYWINAYCRRRPLRYIGFDGQGHQVRDCLHPRDILTLLEQQIVEGSQSSRPKIVNLSGGIESAMSLRQLSAWCRDRFGAHAIASDPVPRAYDLPWVVLDSTAARQVWDWQPTTPTQNILAEIADHAEQHPDWLELSA